MPSKITLPNDHEKPRKEGLGDIAQSDRNDESPTRPGCLKHQATAEENGLEFQNETTNYKILFEHLPDPYFVIDVEKVIFIDCNPAAESILMMPKDKIIGRSHFEISPVFQKHVNKPTLEYGKELFKKVQKDKNCRFEWEHKRANGEHFLCDVNISLVEVDEGEVILASWRDITKQKENESRLKDTLEQLEASKLGSDNAHWRWTYSDNKNYVDKLLYEILEYDPDHNQFTTENFFELIHPEDHAATKKAHDEIIEGIEDYFDVEFRLRTSQGDYRWFHSRAKGFRDEKNQLLHISGSITEIHYRKQLEKNLIREKEKVIEAEKAKSFFLAKLSHEISSPMDEILGLARLLLDKPIDQDTRDKVHQLYSSSQNLLKLLNDVLDFSKHESDGSNEECDPFNLRDTIESITRLLSKSASNKGIKLLSQIDSHVPLWIKGDAKKLRQVLTILLGNAIKSTEYCEISLSVDIQEKTSHSYKIQFRLILPSFEDSDQDYIDLWQRSSNFDEVLGKKFSESSLGLAICKEIAEQMNGGMSFESSDGVNSIVSFYFLAKEVPKQWDAKNQNEKESKESNIVPYLSVLVVEDTYINKILLCRQLERVGFLADVASNGAEALVMVKAKNYNVIFMDCQMPIMDGYTASRRIRQETSCQAKIIAVSAGFVKEEKEKCLAAGMDEIISKPVKLKDIQDILKNIMPQRKIDLHLESPKLMHAGAPIVKEIKNNDDRIKILLLEDDDHFAHFYMESCLNSPKYYVKRYLRLADACGETERFDVILNDLDVMDSRGIGTFKGLKVHFPDTPIIILAGDANIEDSEIALDHGAYNYIKKEHIDPRLLKTEINFAMKRSSFAARLTAARVEAERQSAYKTTFLAHFSHEIRTPLNAVVGMTRLLSDTPLDGSQRELLDGLQIGSSRLLCIINDILDISKIESGKMRLENTSFNLRQLVDECLTLYTPEAEEKGVLLSDYFDARVPLYISSDPNRIRQVLSNYVSNALKYAPQGSIQVLVSILDDKIRIGVKDSGKGLSQDQCEKLFSPFVQVTLKDTIKGTGLGLVVCKKLAILMGGDAGVCCAKGDGCEFWFTLSPVKMQMTSKETNECEGLRVILITSDKNMAEIIVSQLENSHIFCLTQSQLNNDVSLYDNWDAIFLDTRYSTLNQENEDILSHLDSKVVYITENRMKKFNFCLRPPYTQFRTLQVIARMKGQKIQKIKPECQELYNISKLIGSRILIVDDDTLNRKVLEKILGKYGLTADQASNGEEALVKILGCEPYDMIFMDCMMPVKDGYETSRELRKLGIRSFIVALTANAFQKDKDKCLSSGMDLFLTKPINQEDIVIALEALAKLKVI